MGTTTSVEVARTGQSPNVPLKEKQRESELSINSGKRSCVDMKIFIRSSVATTVQAEKQPIHWH